MKKCRIFITSVLAGSMLLLGNVSVSAQKSEPRFFKLPDVSQFFSSLSYNDLPVVTKEIKPLKTSWYNVNGDGDITTLEYLFEDTYDNLNRLTSSLLYKHDELTDSMVQAYRNEYVYNSDNLITNYINYEFNSDSSEWVNRYKSDIVYSDLRKDIPVTYDFYYFNTDENIWNPYEYLCLYCDYKVDEQQRVISATRSTVRDLENPEIHYLAFKFNYTDGVENPTSIDIYEHFGNGNTATYYLEDIKWHKCNNHFVKFGDFIGDIFDGDKENSFEAFNAYDFENDTKMLAGTLKYAYDDNDDLSGIELVALNDYNSYKKSSEITEYGYMTTEVREEGKIDSNNIKTPSNITTETTKYDTYGNLFETTYSEKNSYNDFTRITGTINEYTDNGRLSSCLDYEIDDKTGDKIYSRKLVFEDYADEVPTGIKESVSDNVKLTINGSMVNVANAEGAEYKVVSIDGKVCLSGTVKNGCVSLENLAEGMYIVNVKGTAVKFIKK